MKTISITLKGYANDTNYLACQNNSLRNSVFNTNYEKKETELFADGFKKLHFHENLHGKKANFKIVINGYYWRGNWADATKEKVSVFYK